VASSAATDCKFEEAKVGDVMVMSTPFFFGHEVQARLDKVEGSPGFRKHTYTLHLHGISFAVVEAAEGSTPTGVVWKEVQ